MKKIVHFGKYYFPDSGGIESVNLTLAKGAILNGYSVTVVCFGKNTFYTEEIIDDVKICRVPFTKIFSSQPISFMYILKCLSESRNANLIHIHFPNFLAAICSLFVSFRTKVIVHWHSDVISKGLLGKIFRPLEFAMLHRANMIIATSEIYANSSKTLNSFSRKVKVIPIGVPDVSFFSEASYFSEKITSKIKGKKVILSVGRLVSYKGFNVLLDAAKLISNDAVIIIVGEGPLMGDLQKKLDLEGLNSKVLLTGKLDNFALQTLFQESFLFCLPSIYRSEAFGVVLLEAMAYGLPIVATNIPGSGVSWVNKNGFSGINVPVGDSQSLAEACNKIIRSELIRNKYSKGSRERFLSEFHEIIFIDRILKVYHNLISS